MLVKTIIAFAPSVWKTLLQLLSKILAHEGMSIYCIRLVET
jgi:hypothetical protein